MNAAVKMCGDLVGWDTCIKVSEQCCVFGRSPNLPGLSPFLPEARPVVVVSIVRLRRRTRILTRSKLAKTDEAGQYRSARPPVTFRNCRHDFTGVKCTSGRSSSSADPWLAGIFGRQLRLATLDLGGLKMPSSSKSAGLQRARCMDIRLATAHLSWDGSHLPNPPALWRLQSSSYADSTIQSACGAFCQRLLQVAIA
jgi:hypothetical protein